MIDRDLHDIVVTRNLHALVRRKLVGGAEGETASVDVKHYGTLAGKARRPDVQLQHVLTLPAVVPILDEGLLRACPGVQVLRAVGPIHQRGELVRPRFEWLRREPAVLAGCGLAIGYALEGENTAVEESAHLAVLRVGYRRAGGRDVAGLLMNPSLDAVGSECGTAGCKADACCGG